MGIADLISNSLLQKHQDLMAQLDLERQKVQQTGLTSTASANLDNVNARLLPAKTAADIGYTQAQTGLTKANIGHVGAQTAGELESNKFIGGLSRAKIRNDNAQSTYYGAQSAYDAPLDLGSAPGTLPAPGVPRLGLHGLGDKYGNVDDFHKQYQELLHMGLGLFDRNQQ